MGINMKGIKAFLHDAKAVQTAIAAYAGKPPASSGKK